MENSVSSAVAQQKATQEPLELQGIASNAGTLESLQDVTSVTSVWFDGNAISLLKLWAVS
jgi:hypothetical protein